MPADLLADASTDPEAFVRRLASAQVSAGLEVGERARSTADWKLEPLRPRPTVALSTLVAAFNNAHAAYKAVVLDGVVVIRPRKSAATFLDQPAPDHLTAVGLVRAARILFTPLDPTLAQGPGAGSALGGTDTEAESASFNLNLTGQSVAGVLNRIVLAVPGRAWIVVTDGESPATIIQAGFVRRTGITYIGMRGKEKSRPILF